MKNMNINLNTFVCNDEILFTRFNKKQKKYISLQEQDSSRMTSGVEIMNKCTWL